MRLSVKVSLAMIPIFMIGITVAAAQESVVKLGAGSYTTVQPGGTKAPPAKIYETENFKGKMPNTQWWSSLAWSSFPNRQYPHPLAVNAEAKGLRIYYPGPHITADKGGFHGQMPGKADDLTIGDSKHESFAAALIDNRSDWFVDVRFGSASDGMKVSYGHGSPFVFVTYEGGNPEITFAKTPKVWAGSAKTAVLGVSVNGANYGLFGATGTTWKGLDGSTFTNDAGGKKYFAVALLPDNSEKTLELFKKFAYAHVIDTKVDWAFDSKTSKVTTTFTYKTKAYEGKQEGTLFALYPHQWRNNAEKPTYLGEYSSVRGKMKLAEGTSFKTAMTYTGVLPSLPVTAGVNKETLSGLLKPEAAGGGRGFGDTYGDGKWMGRYAQLAPLADQCGQTETAKALREKVRKHLEGWFTAEGKTRGLFYYNSNWGILIGYPASYFSDNPGGDHHFHYGYFIKAAAEIARNDPAWGKDDKFGGMVKLLIRDIANWNRQDKMFPFMRCFDVYEGHSWADGAARFADGNDQESSSEAMNAWSGMILFGEATGNKELRDMGIALWTTEANAIHEYWFDVHGENFPKGFTRACVGMVWGGQAGYFTWFSGAPHCIQGINWLPIHGGSLYLGNYPDYCQKSYDGMAAANGGSYEWKGWQDIVWMFRALSNAPDAVKMYEAHKNIGYFDGNGQANTYAWIYALNDLGTVDTSVTSDCALYAVFKKGKTHNYVAYNVTDGPRTVLFSDGFRLQIPGKGFGVGKKE